MCSHELTIRLRNGPVPTSPLISRKTVGLPASSLRCSPKRVTLKSRMNPHAICNF